MRHTRTLITAVIVTALAVSLVGALALGAPPKTRLIVVNGVPGSRVDVCVNGNEKVSGLRYGRSAAFEIGNTKKVVRFARAAAGACKGAFLGKRVFDPPASGWDLTLVVTKKAPKRVTTFANAFPGWTPGEVQFGVRHASDIAEAMFYFEVLGSPQPIGPDVAGSPSPSPFAKGDHAELDGDVSANPPVRIAAEKASNGKRLASTKFFDLTNGRLQQVILVGTKGKNAKAVLTDHKARPQP